MAATFKPFFIPQKEIDFFDAVNEELIDNIAGQYVDIYKVSLEETETNVYGEAVGGGQKVFEKGYRVNCLLRFNEPEIEMTEGIGADLNANIDLKICFLARIYLILIRNNEKHCFPHIWNPTFRTKQFSAKNIYFL